MVTDAIQFLGKTVSLVIDRPLGSKHPRFDCCYRCNYGEVPGTMAADGEPLDAYLLGVFAPVSKYTGRCIAVIHRTAGNDIEDKLVVVPPDAPPYSDEQIRALVNFQERFFVSDIIRL